MAAKPDASGYENFSDVTARLDEIVSAVRNKDTSLERSLDLFDEAIALGTRAVDLVDKAAFSPEEKERLVAPPVEAGTPGDSEASEVAASEGGAASGAHASADGAGAGADTSGDAASHTSVADVSADAAPHDTSQAK